MLFQTGVMKKGHVFSDMFIARCSQLSRTVHQHIITTESQTLHQQVLITVTDCASAVFAKKSRTVHHDVLTTNSHELCINRCLQQNHELYVLTCSQLTVTNCASTDVCKKIANCAS